MNAFREMHANSVPPPLAEALGRSIMVHSRVEQPDVVWQVLRHFKEWLSVRLRESVLRTDSVVSGASRSEALALVRDRLAVVGK